MIRASRNPFNERTLELSVDHDAALALHGEIIVLSHAQGPVFGGNTQRLLAILERHLVNGDLTEFSS